MMTERQFNLLYDLIDSGLDRICEAIRDNQISDSAIDRIAMALELLVPEATWDKHYEQIRAQEREARRESEETVKRMAEHNPF